jgi:hypothetical protein
MTYKIIVARYNENIQWLKEEADNCIFYNKGTKMNISNEIILPNVGRESETYLNYIINNYNNLPDIVIFTQANISDHRGSNDVNYLFKLKEEAEMYGKSLPTVHHNYINNPSKYWGPFWNIHPEYKEPYYLNNNYKNNNRKTFFDWFVEFINNNYPNPINIYGNGLFAVQKKIILQKPLDYYKLLITQVNHHINPAEGHFFERSWFYIFNINDEPDDDDI